MFTIHNTFKQQLKNLDACSEAIAWVGRKSLKTAWAKTERGDWMLWLAKKVDIDLRTLTKAKVECAKLVKHLMKDERSLKALDVAERFANNKATREELDAAATAAFAAADAAYAASAVDVAVAFAAADAAAAYSYAAAIAADAAVDAAFAAAATTTDSFAAADAIDVAAADAAYRKTKNDILSQAADICREYIPVEMIAEKL